MTLIVQIVLGLAVVVGLVTIIMSSKNWHWTQLTLVLFIFFAAIGFTFLGAETVRIHQNLRQGIPRLEEQIATLVKQNEQLLHGSDDQPGIQELDHRLQILTRERGRVWRGVQPGGPVDAQGFVSVDIPKPTPHGLDKDAIVYAFETGPPNAAAPAEGRQYLGEFRVIEVQGGGVRLEPILLVDNRVGQRLSASDGPWSLYETMPIDRHRLFAGIPEEAIRQMLPAESVEEYLRHGSEATADDDEWHVTGLDDNGERVGPEKMDQAVQRLYDRPLRDYAFIFNKLAGEKVVALARQTAVKEDNSKLLKAQKAAESTGAFRQRQIELLNVDLTGVKQDRAAIEAHRDAVLDLLAHFQERIEGYREVNASLAEKFAQEQFDLASYINSVAPAP
ncbi:MAG: hypothetical protein ACR2NM_10110 [Bythopirellula sp.]